MKNKRGNVAVITIIIVIVAITAGAIGWMFATKSQAPVQQAAVIQPISVEKTQPITQSESVNETADWQTYANANLGFSIKYPVSYIAKLGNAKISHEDTTFFISNPKKDEITVSDTNDSKLYNYAVSLELNSKFVGSGSSARFLTPEDWFTNAVETTGGPNQEHISYTKLSIDGEIAYVHDDESIAFPAAVPVRVYEFFKKRNDGNYDMYTFKIRKDDIGEIIMSTFKFTK
jgi:hypothetical protein